MPIVLALWGLEEGRGDRLRRRHLGVGLASRLSLAFNPRMYFDLTIAILILLLIAREKDAV